MAQRFIVSSRIAVSLVHIHMAWDFIADTAPSLAEKAADSSMLLRFSLSACDAQSSSAAAASPRSMRALPRSALPATR
eukprot:2646779-Prymnesium_polylepis.1